MVTTLDVFATFNMVNLVFDLRDGSIGHPVYPLFRCFLVKGYFIVWQFIQAFFHCFPMQRVITIDSLLAKVPLDFSHRAIVLGWNQRVSIGHLVVPWTNAAIETIIVRVAFL